jgi:hypothetical protein
MIEIGVPRETAIYLNAKLFDKNEFDKKGEVDIELTIRNVIKKKYTSLPFWIQVQLEFMI